MHAGEPQCNFARLKVPRGGYSSSELLGISKLEKRNWKGEEEGGKNLNILINWLTSETDTARHVAK